MQNITCVDCKRIVDEDDLSICGVCGVHYCDTEDRVCTCLCAESEDLGAVPEKVMVAVA